MSSQDIQNLIIIYEGERDRLQRDVLDPLENEVRDFQAELINLAFDLEQANIRLVRAKGEEASVNLAKEEAGAEKLLEDFDDDYAVRVQPLKWLISKHEGEIARLKPEISRINEEIKRLENELKIKEKEKNEKKAALDRGDYKTGNAEEMARKELENLQDDINGIKSQINNNKSEVEPMANEVETTQEIIDDFREQVKDADSERERLVSKKEYWELELWAAESRVEERQGEVNSIQSSIDETNSDIAIKQGQIRMALT